MNKPRQLLAALSCLATLPLLSPPAQASTSRVMPPCVSNRYGVERCGPNVISPGHDKPLSEQCDQDCENAAAKAHLQRYCASQKQEGKSATDGLCAQHNTEADQR